MNKTALAATILAASTLFAFAPIAQAAEESSLSGHEMNEGATTKGGKTDMPTAKPDETSLSGKHMKDSPTTMGGKTDMPNAKPEDGSIVSKEMKDHPGAQK